jgi:two-component system response regulator LytT
MLRAFIVDDEPLAREELGYLLRRTRQVEVVGEAESLDAALALIRELKPDVVFADIQLADSNGLDLAHRLLAMEPKLQIVFATAYDEYALKAFELNATDYLLKPYDEQRIVQTVNKLAKRHAERAFGEQEAAAPKASLPEKRDKLAINTDDRILLIPTDSIIYLYSEDKKTIIVTNNQHIAVNDPLTTLEQKLQHTSIMRVHRSYLANLERIVEIQPWFHSTCTLIMTDGSKVPVSRMHLKELKQRIGI